MKYALVSIVMMSLVIGCSYPTTQVRVTDERPTIAIQGAPANAVLYVDGLNMGLANTFNGSQLLILEPGTHKIEIKSQEKTLLSEKVFLGEGTAKIFSVSGQ